MINPAPLQTGDTVAIVSPAGALRDTAVVEKSKDLLESWGLQVHIAPHTLMRNGYYSGTAEERISDFRTCLHDSNIKAILCSYGGYGCVHLLNDLAPLIEENPKWIIGMSDCSALHAVCLSKGIMSIHSPQCNHLSKHPDCVPTRMLKDILFGKKPTYNTPSHALDIKGNVTGKLAGGNLSVLSALIGTEYDIFKNADILFIEDTEEQPYRIERIMYQLELSGILSRLKGIIVGEFNGINENNIFGGTTYELIHNIIKRYDIPACFRFPVGHSEANMPLIEGATVTLNIEKSKTELKF